jgi:hypothetical protein
VVLKVLGIPPKECRAAIEGRGVPTRRVRNVEIQQQWPGFAVVLSLIQRISMDL